MNNQSVNHTAEMLKKDSELATQLILDYVLGQLERDKFIKAFNSLAQKHPHGALVNFPMPLHHRGTLLHYVCRGMDLTNEREHYEPEKTPVSEKEQVEKRCVDVISYLVKLGSNTIATNKYLEMPLLKIVEDARSPIMLKFFINDYSDIFLEECRNDKGDNLMHIAVSRRDRPIELVECLVNECKKENLFNMENFSQEYPIEFILSKSFKTLETKKPSLNFFAPRGQEKNEKINTALLIMALKFTKNLDQIGFRKESVLYLENCRKNPVFIDLIFRETKSKIDVNSMNFRRETPLHSYLNDLMDKENQLKKLTEQLETEKKKINKKLNKEEIELLNKGINITKEQKTKLENECKDIKAIMKKLLQNGANIHILNGRNQTVEATWSRWQPTKSLEKHFDIRLSSEQKNGVKYNELGEKKKPKIEEFLFRMQQLEIYKEIEPMDFQYLYDQTRGRLDIKNSLFKEYLDTYTLILEPGNANNNSTNVVAKDEEILGKQLPLIQEYISILQIRIQRLNLGIGICKQLRENPNRHTEQEELYIEQLRILNDDLLKIKFEFGASTIPDIGALQKAMDEQVLNEGKLEKYYKNLMATIIDSFNYVYYYEQFKTARELIMQLKGKLNTGQNTLINAPNHQDTLSEEDNNNNNNTLGRKSL